MPELPEVETTLRGIEPHIKNQLITKIIVRERRLRWPIPKNISLYVGCHVMQLMRRGKYILLQTERGTMILHLGMSGRVRILSKDQVPEKHDHFDLVFANDKILRYTDPRRFGAFLSAELDETHTLMQSLGVEPLEADFTAVYLHTKLAKKSLAIKSAIMDSKIVVGVGNIYATESLHLAGIHPEMPAKLVTPTDLTRLVKAIKQILRAAIKQGGTTLRDFSSAEGKPGYFVQKLKAYGRAGLPCYTCGSSLKQCRIGQRSSVYCERCQAYSA